MTKEEAIKFIEYLIKWLEPIASDDIINALKLAINSLQNYDFAY
jgi:hypothetical protein